MLGDLFDVEIYFEGIIGEGVAASQIAPESWVGSLNQFEPTKGYWAKVNNDFEFNLLNTNHFITPTSISNSWWNFNQTIIVFTNK